MSTISTKNTVAGDQRPVTSDLKPETCHLEPGTCHLEPGTWNLEPGTWNLEPGTWNLEPKNEAAGKEKLLVSMKEKAAILRHLQEKDIVQGADAKEIKDILVDLDETIKALETSNV